jgi:hypothetical protein
MPYEMIFVAWDFRASCGGWNKAHPPYNKKLPNEILSAVWQFLWDGTMTLRAHFVLDLLF